MAAVYQMAFPMEGARQFKVIDGEVMPGRTRAVKPGVAFKSRGRSKMKVPHVCEGQDFIDFKGVVATSIGRDLSWIIDESMISVPELIESDGPSMSIGMDSVFEFFEEE